MLVFVLTGLLSCLNHRIYFECRASEHTSWMTSPSPTNLPSTQHPVTTRRQLNKSKPVPVPRTQPGKRKLLPSENFPGL